MTIAENNEVKIDLFLLLDNVYINISINPIIKL